MLIVNLKNLSAPELAPYASLTEAQLRRAGDDGIIIVESPKVILTALESGLQPLSLLCERKHIEGDAACIIERCPQDMPVYTGDRQTLASLTGYTLTRGVLCAMRRPQLPSADEILQKGRRVCVIYDVCDSTNIGVIFRTAAALGFDGVILSPESCDPFNRRCIRVSMGAVFKIPWCYDSDILASLKSHGFKSISMALRDDSVSMADLRLPSDEKCGILLGSEGYGLPADIIAASDLVVRIPMHYGIDSLNVGAAAAIALWFLR